MSTSELLLLLLLPIVAIVPLVVLVWYLLKRQATTESHLKTLHLTESARVQTLMNLMLAKDFPTFAGLQQLSQGPLSQPGQPTLANSLDSEYIPRDDATEALRLKNFGAGIGYGDVIFDPEDEDMAELMSDLISGGQVDLDSDG